MSTRPSAAHHKLNSKTARAKALATIQRAFARYGLTVREFTCRFDPQGECFRYTLVAARGRSGVRGGHPRNLRRWVLTDLDPDARRAVSKLPRLLSQPAAQYNEAVGCEFAEVA